MSLLTEQEIIDIRKATRGNGETAWSDSIALARSVEAKARAKLIEEIKAQGLAGHWNGNCAFPIFVHKTDASNYAHIPLYRLPEGD